MVLSNDGNHIIVGNEQGEVTKYDRYLKNLSPPVKLRTDEPVTALLDTEHYTIIGGGNGTTLVWNSETAPTIKFTSPSQTPVVSFALRESIDAEGNHVKDLYVSYEDGNLEGYAKFDTTALTKKMTFPKNPNPNPNLKNTKLVLDNLGGFLWLSDFGGWIQGYVAADPTGDPIQFWPGVTGYKETFPINDFIQSKNFGGYFGGMLLSDGQPSQGGIMAWFQFGGNPPPPSPAETFNVVPITVENGGIVRSLEFGEEENTLYSGHENGEILSWKIADDGSIKGSNPTTIWKINDTDFTSSPITALVYATPTS